MKNLVSIKQLGKAEILALLERAAKLKKHSPGPILQGQLMASCFFEPSTRTRLSFEAAMKRLGGEVIGFSDHNSLSTQKGESLHDSIKVIGLYSDVIVLRHPLEGAARHATEATEKPVINAGDGANEHPTQTLLDLFTIQEAQNSLEGLRIAFVGDLLYGRTVHSLVYALKHFSPRLYFISPPSLSMPESICEELKRAGIPYSFHQSIDEVMDRTDILYMTRMQKERYALQNYQKGDEGRYLLTPDCLKKGGGDLKILHPLPRVDEIAREVDQTKQAYYFTQAENGLYVRQAILCEVLGK